MNDEYTNPFNKPFPQDKHLDRLNELIRACEMAEYCLDPINEEIVTEEDRQRAFKAIESALRKARS